MKKAVSVLLGFGQKKQVQSFNLIGLGCQKAIIALAPGNEENIHTLASLGKPLLVWIFDKCCEVVKRQWRLSSKDRSRAKASTLLFCSGVFGSDYPGGMASGIQYGNHL